MNLKHEFGAHGGDKGFRLLDYFLCVGRLDGIAFIVGHQPDFVRPVQEASHLFRHRAVFDQIIAEGFDQAAMSAANIGTPDASRAARAASNMA